VNESTESLLARGWRLFRQHPRLFASLVFAGGIAGLALSYCFTPVYKADATLVPSEEMQALSQNTLLGGLGGIASLVGGAQGNKENEAVAVLKSRALTCAYIETNGLLPILFHNRWDATAHKWKPGRKIPTVLDGFRDFDNGIRLIVENQKTGIITISVTWEDPTLAKQWADGLVRMANDRLRSEAIERSSKNLEYLQGASEKTTVTGVKETIYKLMESEIKKQMISVANVDYAFRVIDPTVVPEKKVFPKRTLFSGLGAAVGGIAWLLVAMLKDRAAGLKTAG